MWQVVGFDALRLPAPLPGPPHGYLNRFLMCFLHVLVDFLRMSELEAIRKLLDQKMLEAVEAPAEARRLERVFSLGCLVGSS